MSETVEITGLELATKRSNAWLGKSKKATQERLPFRAAGWRIVVQPVPAKTETDGGLALPDETVEVQKANEYRGTVVSVGSLAYMDPVKFHPNGVVYKPWCKVGDVVAYNRYAGQKMVTKSGDEYRALNDEDIIAVITDPAAMRNPY